MKEILQKLINCINSIDKNKKELIDEITFLSKTFKNNFEIASIITELLFDKISKAASDQLKLVYFYTLDSIFKNDGNLYNKCTETYLTRHLFETFKYAMDQNIKTKLRKLRITWSEKHFTKKFLNTLDETMSTIDPEWLIYINDENIKSEKMIKLDIIPAESFTGKENVCNYGNVNFRNSGSSDKSSLTQRVFGNIDVNKIENYNQSMYSTQCVPEFPIFNVNIPPPALPEHYLGRECQSNNAGNFPVISKLNTDLRFLFQNSETNVNMKRKSDSFLNSNTSMKKINLELETPTVAVVQETSKKEWCATDILSMLTKVPQHVANVEVSPPVHMIMPRPMYGQTPPMVPYIHNINLNMGNGQHLLPMNPVYNTKNIYRNRWQNDIVGFPMMPEIFTDPRLLMFVPNPATPSSVFINNQEVVVLLDRIQPYVYHDNGYRVIRYDCSYIKMIIDGVEMELSANEVNFVKIRNFPMTIILGGPYNEIILNGEPYHVPMTGKSYSISVHNVDITMSFCVKKEFRYRILGQIPDFVFDWAEAGHFGHPSCVYAPPLNPLDNPQLWDVYAMRFRNEMMGMSLNRPPVNHPVQYGHVVSSVIEVKPSIHCQLPNIKNTTTNSHKEILPPTKKEETMNLTFDRFSLSLFRKFNGKEYAAMNVNPQCWQCGHRWRPKDISSDEHMDYDFKKNSKTIIVRKCRGYWSRSDVWSSGLPNPRRISERNTNNNHKEEDEELKVEKRCRAFDDIRLNKCSVCLERLVSVWDDKEDNYMLQNAVAANGKVYHPICLEDESLEPEENNGEIEKCVLVKKENDDDDNHGDVHPFDLLNQLLTGGGFN